MLENISTQIENFLKRCADKRLTNGSLRRYRAELNTLKKLLTDKQDLGAYLQTLAVSTHHSKLVIWKNFARQSARELRPLLDPLPFPRVINKLPLFLSGEEINKIKAAELPRDEKLYVHLLLDLGLRVGELKKIKRSDFDGEWVRIKRKGGNEQRLPLTQTIQSLVADLTIEPTDKICRYSIRWIQLLIGAISEKILGRKISPHALRHSFATRAMCSGANIRALQEFMGHKSITTTSRYLHISAEDLKTLQNLNS